MLNLINEPGLYRLILTSRKPEAKAFKRWVIHEVLPALRKTGYYFTQVLPVLASVQYLGGLSIEAALTEFKGIHGFLAMSPGLDANQAYLGAVQRFDTLHGTMEQARPSRRFFSAKIKGRMEKLYRKRFTVYHTRNRRRRPISVYQVEAGPHVGVRRGRKKQPPRRPRPTAEGWEGAGRRLGALPGGDRRGCPRHPRPKAHGTKVPTRHRRPRGLWSASLPAGRLVRVRPLTLSRPQGGGWSGQPCKPR